MASLRTLGTLDLTAADGRSLRSALSQPRRAALLVYLATVRPYGPQRRGRLLPLFWPDSDQAAARHALNQSLYALRRSLSPAVVRTEGRDVLELNEDLVTCDVRVFDKALAEHRWADALELNRGDFLCGFEVSDAPAFERWVDEERSRLRESTADAGWKLATEQLHRGAATEAERTARRSVRLVPTDEERVLEFVKGLARAGDRAAAVCFFQRWADALAANLELSPAPETEEAIRELRGR